MNHSDRLEMLGQIIDGIEDWLDSKDIVLPDSEKASNPDFPNISGRDYDKLSDMIESTLIEHGVLDKETKLDELGVEKRFALYVHNNYGASSFDFDMIYRIETALRDKGLDGSVFKAPCIEWKGLPGEELIFEPAGSYDWQDYERDMLDISRAIPECSFCLHVGEYYDGCECVEYFHDGQCEATTPNYSGNFPDPVSGIW